ncbi:MAG: PilZ domain-containing protein [Myxococcota bacterium]
MTSPKDRRNRDRRKGNATVAVERRRGAERRTTDRRRSVRAPMDLWMEEFQGEDMYFRRVGNLSLGGVYFEQTIPHKLGTRLTLKFSIPGHERIIETAGQVVSAPGHKEGLGMGVRFLSLAPEDRKLLETYIAEMGSTSHGADVDEAEG